MTLNPLSGAPVDGKPKCQFWSSRGACGESPRWACDGTKAPRSAKRDCYSPSGELEDKSAPSEDEGEKWGRLLHGLRNKIARKNDCTTQWRSLTLVRRVVWIETALRFRAKCIAPGKDLEGVVRGILEGYEKVAATAPMGSSSLSNEHYKLLKDALPDQGEAPAEKKAPVSDDEPRPADGGRTCPHCQGFGWRHGLGYDPSPQMRCEICDGTGRVKQKPSSAKVTEGKP